MLSMLRMTLLCLLALAIPAQGFAGASRLLCGPGHHEVAARLSPSAHEAGDAMAGHEHAAVQGHHHAGTHHTAGEASPTLLDPPSDGRCVACAACCTAVALPVPVMPMPMAPPLLSALPLALGTSPCPAFITGGPDRPPRSVLA